jgi:hypothetical protein
MKIAFTAPEMHTILHYASMIYETKKLNGVRNKKYTTYIDDYALHLIGLMGESGLCKVLDIPFHVDLLLYGDDGTDIRYADTSIQVKTLSKDYGTKNRLYVDDIEDVRSHILVGAAITGPASVRLIGAISKDKFRRIKTVEDFGYGPRHTVNESQLSSIEDMLKLFEGATHA